MIDMNMRDNAYLAGYAFMFSVGLENIFRAAVVLTEHVWPHIVWLLR